MSEIYLGFTLPVRMTLFNVVIKILQGLYLQLELIQTVPYLQDTEGKNAGMFLREEDRMVPEAAVRKRKH